MDEIIIREIWLPDRVNAVTVPDEYGDYNIYINDKLCFNQRDKAVRHELEHIKNGDFESFVSAAIIEKRVKDKLS